LIYTSSDDLKET